MVFHGMDFTIHSPCKFSCVCQMIQSRETVQQYQTQGDHGQRRVHSIYRSSRIFLQYDLLVCISDPIPFGNNLVRFPIIVQVTDTILCLQ